MTKTIYLVNPPDKGMLSGFPGALLFLKAWLRMTTPEINVQYIDLAISKKDIKPVMGTKDAIIEELSEYKIEEGAIYALTSTTATYQNAVQAARAIKEIDSIATTILGGHHAMHQTDQVLYWHPEIDYCALGEGEKTLEDLAEVLTKGKKPEEVRGLAWRDKFGLIKGQQAEFLSREELDKFQFNAFDWSPIYESLKDASLRGQFGYFDISTARGCNLKCTFCTFGDDQLRDMSPDAKAQLLSDIVDSEMYKHARGLNIHDNDFAQNTKKTHELCDIIIARDMNMRWTIQTRVEHLNDRNRELVEKLAKAGCTEVYLGVENFDAEIAQYLKHVKNAEKYVQDTKEAVANTLEYGIGCNINLQLGVPGETKEARQRNLEALRKVAETAERIAEEKGIQAYVTVYPQLSVVYPGTAMARMPVRGTKTMLHRDAFEEFTEWEWEKEQEGFTRYLGKNFAHGNGGIPLGLIDVEGFVHNGHITIVPEKFDTVQHYVDSMKAIAREHPILNIFDYSAHIVK